jgi:hypothetical protein
MLWLTDREELGRWADCTVPIQHDWPNCRRADLRDPSGFTNSGSFRDPEPDRPTFKRTFRCDRYTDFYMVAKTATKLNSSDLESRRTHFLHRVDALRNGQKSAREKEMQVSRIFVQPHSSVAHPPALSRSGDQCLTLLEQRLNESPDLATRFHALLAIGKSIRR